jgi:hypothetical protein
MAVISNRRIYRVTRKRGTAALPGMCVGAL